MWETIVSKGNFKTESEKTVEEYLNMLEELPETQSSHQNNQLEAKPTPVINKTLANICSWLLQKVKKTFS